MAWGMCGAIAGAARAVSAEVLRADIAVSLGGVGRSLKCNAPLHRNQSLFFLFLFFIVESWLLFLINISSIGKRADVTLAWGP